MIQSTKNLAAAAALIFSFSAAEANTVNVSGAGIFGSTTPTTMESASGQTFSFSFITQDPIPGNPDSTLINPMFSLAGSLTSPTFTSVDFGNDSNGGLFNLVFSDHVLSFYGATINSGGYLQSGLYSAAVGLDNKAPIGNGIVAVSVSVSPVPLPASAPMFGAALLALAASGFLFKRGRGTQVSA